MVTGNTKKSSYTSYYFSSIEEGNDGDYQEDLKYMEICVMDEEHALSEKQKEHMWLYTGR